MLNKNNTKNIANVNLDNNNECSYFWGLDLIRVLAMFFVILVHSTTFYGFTNTNINSFALFIVGMGRYLSFTCVPLFMVLTGFLNYSKKPSKKYYLKIIKVLIEFVLCGVVVAIINKLCFNSSATLSDIALKILIFEFPSYSWYIKMYLVLFFLTPFLNYFYKAIPDKYRWVIIIGLCLIFSNTYISTAWFHGYPIMYYFIGLFLRDKKFKVNKLVLLISILVICILQTMLFKYKVAPNYLVENHNNLGCVMLTVTIFLLFYDLKINNVSKVKTKTCKILRTIANASLATFLVSVIFESFTSELFSKLSLTTFTSKLPYLAYLTPLKFILSVICGIVINITATQLFKFIKYIFNCFKLKISKSNNNNF